jgi:hypothetical protein
MPGCVRQAHSAAPPLPCTLTLYWPEGAPQDAAAPLLGWALVTQERRGDERCTVVVAPPAAHSCCAHASPRCVGQLRVPCTLAGRPPDDEGMVADTWVTLSATPGGVPTLLELRLHGRRANVSANVMVLYKARCARAHALTHKPRSRHARTTSSFAGAGARAL